MKNTSLKLLATFVIAGLSAFGLTVPSQAVVVNPTPVCIEGTCTVTYDYSGDYAIWTPPAGVEGLHFDVYGAQGGRTGGKGGLVSGDFAVIPTSLYVYVGGAGMSANSAPGGFNGGGASGNGHGDQGSGGGASDLRTSTNIGDRVVVAGGGGGTGGWIGGAGGPGGLTLASAGTKGAPTGTAGGGGTQLAGGVAGLGVSTGNGTAGNLGVGGIGGSGSIAGGGGGGGGYYGGGGGGSDNTSGGSDGAGGGGGSSFATMALSTNVSHAAGVRAGNGQVVLTYTFAPQVLLFTSSNNISTTGTINYQLRFDQFVYGLDTFDFQFAGTASGCYVSSLTGDGYLFSVGVSGCSNGTVSLSLSPSSVYGATFGPKWTASANSVTVDASAPNLHLSTPLTPSPTGTLKYLVTSDEQFNRPLASAFQLSGSGCVISGISMVSSSTAEVTVSGCSSGANVLLVLLRNQIRDLAGNPGPAVDMAAGDVLIDLDAPSLLRSSTIVSADLIRYDFEFSEEVTGVTANAFSVAGTGCQISKVDGSKATYQVWLSGCQDQSSLTVKNRSVADLAGNYGPASDSAANGTLDTAAPTAVFSELSRSDKTVSPTYELRFDEVVSGLTLGSLSRSGTAKNCIFDLAEVTAGRVYRISVSSCASGSLRLVLLEKSVLDSHGNAGPVADLESSTAKILSAPPAAAAASAESVLQQPKPSSSPLTPVTKQKSATVEEVSQSTQSIQTRSTSPVSSDSWVAIGIALIALGLARRPRGRRVAA